MGHERFYKWRVYIGPHKWDLCFCYCKVFPQMGDEYIPQMDSILDPTNGIYVIIIVRCSHK